MAENPPNSGRLDTLTLPISHSPLAYVPFPIFHFSVCVSTSESPTNTFRRALPFETDDFSSLHYSHCLVPPLQLHYLAMKTMKMCEKLEKQGNIQGGGKRGVCCVFKVIRVPKRQKKREKSGNRGQIGQGKGNCFISSDKQSF